jgi:hypothetical protein
MLSYAYFKPSRLKRYFDALSTTDLTEKMLILKNYCSLRERFIQKNDLFPELALQ